MNKQELIEWALGEVGASAQVPLPANHKYLKYPPTVKEFLQKLFADYGAEKGVDASACRDLAAEAFEQFKKNVDINRSSPTGSDFPPKR